MATTDDLKRLSEEGKGWSPIKLSEKDFQEGNSYGFTQSSKKMLEDNTVISHKVGESIWTTFIKLEDNQVYKKNYDNVFERDKDYQILVNYLGYNSENKAKDTTLCTSHLYM